MVASRKYPKYSTKWSWLHGPGSTVLLHLVGKTARQAVYNVGDAQWKAMYVHIEFTYRQKHCVAASM